MSRNARIAATVTTLALVTAFGAFVRADQLGARSFSVDEVLHVFAARSLRQSDTPVLPSGEPYRRALPVTRAVAASVERWGESEAAARLPIVVTGVLAIPALFALTARLFGPAAGLLAAFLLAASPDAVAMSRFVRMYQPAQLLVVLGALACWVGLAPRARGGAAFGGLAGGALLLGVASWLHPETLAFLPPLALFTTIVAASEARRAGWRVALRRPAALVLVAGAAAALAALAVAPDLVTGPIRRGLTRLPWFPQDAWDANFYHWYLADTYSYLWFLAPAATLAACLLAGLAGLYAALLFWVPFLAVSALVPTQSPRYVFLFLPFLFALLGEGGRAAGALLLGRLEARLTGGLVPPGLARKAAVLVLAVMAAVVVRGSSWFAAAQANRMKTVGEFAGASYEQWREAAAYVRAEGADDAVFVANSDHLALYYFGRIDGRLLYAYQAPHAEDRDVERTPHGWRFVSYRTGAASFSDAEDLEAFVTRHPRGWLVVERRRLAAYPSVLAPGVPAVLASRLVERKTPADASLAVFSWDHGARAARAPARSYVTTR